MKAVASKHSTGSNNDNGNADGDKRLFSGDGTVLDMRGLQSEHVLLDVPVSWPR